MSPPPRDDARWHPLQAAVEDEVGVWRMVDSTGRQYGEVRLVKRAGEVGYRAEYWPKNHPREIVGYFRTLRASCERVHMTEVRSHSPGGRGEYVHRTPHGR